MPSQVKIRSSWNASLSCLRFLFTACSSPFLFPLTPNLSHLSNSWSSSKNRVGALVPTELSWTSQGRPWIGCLLHFSTRSHGTLYPSIKLSCIIVPTCLSLHLMARSLGAGPLLAICVAPAHSPVRTSFYKYCWVCAGPGEVI